MQSVARPTQEYCVRLTGRPNITIAVNCGRKAPTQQHSGLEVIKSFFFMLNSVEYEIQNAHKYKNIKKFGIL